MIEKKKKVKVIDRKYKKKIEKKKAMENREK